MKQFDFRKISLRHFLKIFISSLFAGLAVYLVCEVLFKVVVWNPHMIFAFCAFISCILTGMLVYLANKLEHGRHLVEIFKKQASTDHLTELHNRSYLDPFLESEIAAADKYNNQVSMVMIDMDHFKEINDTYGHIVGDHVLAIFAQLVLKCIRKTDKIARYGGDEFIAVLPSTDTATAHDIAERIRQEVSSAYIPPIDGVTISSISCSVGVSSYPALCDSKSTLFKTSDIALYEAKHSGRNCTIVYHSNLTHAC